MRSTKFWIVLLLLCAGTTVARAEVALLLEQPIGGLGRVSASGHAAIYLSRVCTEAPTRLRRCRPGERGVVISSYGRVDQYYWTAMPLVPYLYAVDDLREIPERIDAATVRRLRDTYRREHLESIAPDGPNHKMPAGHWNQLVGSNYERRIYVFEMETNVAQDDRLIERLNAEPNEQTQYNFFFRNCANFAEYVLNFYYPHSVHRSFTTDVGLMTPKQTAKSFVAYARHHKNLQFSAFIMPQVPGTIHRSGKAYGVIEAVLKKKQYMIPLAIWQPYFMAALAGTYLVRGRFNPELNSTVMDRSDEMEALMRDTVPKPSVDPQSDRTVKVSASATEGSLGENCMNGRCAGDLNPVSTIVYLP